MAEFVVYCWVYECDDGGGGDCYVVGYLCV